jgi:hypothetical protein
MTNADAGLELRGAGPQGCEAAARPLVKGIVGRIERVVRSTPFRPCVGRGTLGKIRRIERFSPRRASERSVVAARNVGTSESIRQKIIGHGMAVGGYRPGGCLIRRYLDVGGADIAFAQFEKHASDHGVGIFVDPLIEERIDFFAEIGGVSEARKFVTVQSVAGSGEEKFPRWLGAAGGHGALRWNWITRNAQDRIIAFIILTSKYQVMGLWKTVESEEKPVGACSGCAGDYEDPDRSAWGEDFEEEDADFQEEAEDEPGPDQ